MFCDEVCKINPSAARPGGFVGWIFLNGRREFLRDGLPDLW